MRGTKITLALGVALLFAGPAQTALGFGTAAADEYHGGYGGGYGYRHHDGIGAGGVILGLAAVAGVAALASSAANRDRYYDRGYGYPAQLPPPGGYYGYQARSYGYPGGYGYQGGSYGYQSGYGGYGGYGGGDYTRVSINACASAAVGQAQSWSGGARLGRIESVDRRGDDTWVRGTLRVSGGGYDRDGYGSGYGYESRSYDQREVRFECKFDDGRVRSVRVDRPDYAYNGY